MAELVSQAESAKHSVRGRLAGGPVFVGNDVIDRSYPDPEDREAFFPPLSLDTLIPDWREAEAVEPAEVRLVF